MKLLKFLLVFCLFSIQDLQSASGNENSVFEDEGIHNNNNVRLSSSHTAVVSAVALEVATLAALVLTVPFGQDIGTCCRFACQYKDSALVAFIMAPLLYPTFLWVTMKFSSQ